MSSITVSVVTIVRNDCQNIERTMRSVLNQMYSDREYIIKDGQSNDGTQEIIEKIRKEYPDQKIKFISCKDSGIYDAMNQAVSHCEGEWISFINSGDSFYDENVLSNVFERNHEKYQSIGLICGDAIVRDESGDAVWKADLDLIERKMPFCHQSCFIRRCYAVQFPFDTSLRIAADYNQMLDLYVNHISFEKIEQTIAVFELDGVSSTRFTARFKERNSVIKRHGIRNKNGLLLLLEYMMEMGKTVLIRIVPEKQLEKLKKWYKVNIRHYEIKQ